MPKGERRPGNSRNSFHKRFARASVHWQIDTKEVRSQKSDRLQSPVSDNRNSR